MRAGATPRIVDIPHVGMPLHRWQPAGPISVAEAGEGTIQRTSGRHLGSRERVTRRPLEARIMAPA